MRTKEQLLTMGEFDGGYTEEYFIRLEEALKEHNKQSYEKYSTKTT